MNKNDIKASFFAAHLGARYVSSNVCGEFTDRVGGYFFTNGIAVRPSTRLILTPLDRIADEHAVEVAKIYYIFSLTPTLEVAKSLIHAFINEPHTITSEVADLLRSYGYLLPFMGLDPIKEGWAIVEPENQPK